MLYTHTHTSFSFQTTKPLFCRLATSVFSVIVRIPQTRHHLCKEDSNINQDNPRVLECTFIVTSDLEM